MVLARLRKEIEDITASKEEITREDLKKMTYLSNILKESKFLCVPITDHG